MATKIISKGSKISVMSGTIVSKCNINRYFQKDIKKELETQLRDPDLVPHMK